MSRGPGKWERAILEALKDVAAFYLTDLLPIPHTRSHVVALNRAARNLHDAGKIEIATWRAKSWGASGVQAHGFVSIYRPGYPLPTRKQITRLKRCTGVKNTPTQHLKQSTDRERAR